MLFQNPTSWLKDWHCEIENKVRKIDVKMAFCSRKKLKLIKTTLIENHFRSNLGRYHYFSHNIEREINNSMSKTLFRGIFEKFSYFSLCTDLHLSKKLNFTIKRISKECFLITLTSYWLIKIHSNINFHLVINKSLKNFDSNKAAKIWQKFLCPRTTKAKNPCKKY